jgi:putative N6-adenine-specific DNA methylase
MNNHNEIFEFFASSISGTEGVLCDELRELGFSSVRLNRGGIPFRGTWRDGWRACLQSGIAQRIQVLMNRFQAPTQEALYNGVAAVDWTPFITPRHTISVSAFCVASNLNHSGFLALKAKDAIVDQIRMKDLKGARPSISKDDPDVRIFIYLVNNKASVYLDLSGDGLHRRGYRRDTGEAPLRETLAAALLRLSGWDRKTRFLDPMCGSGTIAIEAAFLASNFAPGLLRERFGFERWANFGERESEMMRELRGELRRLASGQRARIQASDVNGDVLNVAKMNARAAGVRLSFKERSILDMRDASSRTVVVTNPPYDVRLGADAELRHGIASAITRMHGWRVAILAGHDDYRKFISARPEEDFEIPNGSLKCRFLVYEIE